MPNSNDPFPNNPVEIEIVESKESSIVITSGNNVTEMVEQPKPKFTLVDLETIIDEIFADTLYATRQVDQPNLNEAHNKIQQLRATIAKLKNDLDSIDMPSDNNKAIQDTINTETPQFSVCGVQLWENKVIRGVSLYTTVPKARKIRDILNSHYAEQRVNHEAKIVNYPVY